jgi:hypothetical protein
MSHGGGMMEWTTEKPTKPGIYLWKWRGKVHPVTIEILGKGLVTKGSISVPMNAAHVGGQWAGPIPEPTEPHEAGR